MTLFEFKIQNSKFKNGNNSKGIQLRKMTSKMKLLDVVALLEDLPELELYRGQVGTIVEEYEPGVFEVEFSNTEGRAYALETLQQKQLMVLYHYQIG